MLVIRLQRTGRENLPTYRVVLSEKTKHAKKGAKEILGHYLPKGEKPVFECDQARVAHWIALGAQPSDTVARLLTKAGMKGLERFVSRYTKQTSKSPEAASAASAPAPVAAPVAPAASA